MDSFCSVTTLGPLFYSQRHDFVMSVDDQMRCSVDTSPSSTPHIQYRLLRTALAVQQYRYHDQGLRCASGCQSAYVVLQHVMDTQPVIFMLSCGITTSLLIGTSSTRWQVRITLQDILRNHIY